MSTTDHSFGKEHRLCGKKRIDRLFAEGRSFFAHPFRCVWMEVEPDVYREMAPVQVLVSIGKRNHKRAVARNKIKRRTREAYRLNRHRWEGAPLAKDKRLIVGLLYSSKEILDYSTIEHGVVRAIAEIRKQLAADRDPAVCGAD